TRALAAVAPPASLRSTSPASFGANAIGLGVADTARVPSEPRRRDAQRPLAVNVIEAGPQELVYFPVSCWLKLMVPVAVLALVKVPFTPAVVLVVMPKAVCDDTAPVAEKRPDFETLTVPILMMASGLV